MASVTLKNVTKLFGEVAAVNDLTIEVEDKEFLVLVGPSGCGKSTTLRMVAGLEEITKGDLFIGDRLVNDVAPKDRDIAMVFQSYALYPHMSVFDNMAFGLRLRRLSGKEIERRVREAATILGLEQLVGRKPRELSGGQRQRVALGRAIVREPKVFLMDEPLSNLDAKLRVQTRAELNKLHQRLRTTVIYVTHDQTEAMTMGSRIAVMKDGLLQQLDSPQNLYEHPANMFVAEFIGSPSMNFMKGTLTGKPEDVRLDAQNFKCALPSARAKLTAHVGRDVVAGVRPEHVGVRVNGSVRQIGAARGGTELSLTGDGDSGAGRMAAKVEVVEPLGSEAIVYLRGGEHTLVARTPYRPDLRPGGDVEVVIDPKALYIFDAESQAALI